MIKIAHNNLKKPKIEVDKSYKPTRLAFNFSFLTLEKEHNFRGKSIDKKVKAKLIDRLEFLSQSDHAVILGLPKEQGLEKIPESEVSLRKHPEFIKSGRDSACNEVFWVFRLANFGRVIGKMKDKTFFILSIDTKFEQYKH